eukprot:gene17130-biopygen17678
MEEFLAPLNPDTSGSLRVVVYAAFTGTVLFNVVLPQWLFVAALRGRNGPVVRANLAYWQACSLLLFTVYLAICESPMCYATALGSNVAVPLSLWWWTDISERIEEGAAEGGSLEKAWLSWRWGATVVATGTAGAQVLTNRACGSLPDAAALLNDPQCAAWLEPPHYYNVLLHPTLSQDAVLPLVTGSLALYGVRWVLVLLEVVSRGRESYSPDDGALYPSSTTFLARRLNLLNKDQ